MKDDFKVPAAEIDARIRRIQEHLQKETIDGLLIVQRVDLFYFSGTAQKGYLYIPARGKPILFIKKYMPRALQESSIEHIFEIGSIKQIPFQIKKFYGSLPRTLAFELDVVPVNEFTFYEQLFPKQRCVDGSLLIHEVRMIKSPWEISQLENTADLSWKTFTYIKENLAPFHTEHEFTAMVETFARKLGHAARLRIRDPFKPGHSWQVWQTKNGRDHGKLGENAPILIRFGCVLNGYHTIETRMFAMASMPEKVLEACKGTIDMHNETLEKVRPGLSADELFPTSTRAAKSSGYGKTYFGREACRLEFVGHGIGLELVEQPIIARGRKECLKPGMTLALGLRVDFENQFMTGIESVLLVTKSGTRLVSKVPAMVFIC